MQLMPCVKRLSPLSSKGFSLIEVMVTVVITGIGLLGLAAMLTVDVSNGAVARYRSLAALQASSLAAAMSANPAYWAAGLAPASFTVSGPTISDSNLNAQSTTCNTTSCTPLEMAGYDVKNWGSTLANLLPNGSGQVTCSTTTGTAVSCQVTVNWSENNLALHQTSGSIASSNPLSYSIIVQP